MVNLLETHTPPFRSNSRHYRILENISAGDLFVGFLSSAGSTRLMYKVARKRARDRYTNRKAIEELEKCGYVQRIIKSGNVNFFITKEGKQALHNIYKQTLNAAKHPGHWDGAWRVVLYDFPENERSLRNSLRYVLTKCGFLKIQKSVWIFPYDAPLLSSLLANNPVISAHTAYMNATGLTHETAYKKHFKLG